MRFWDASALVPLCVAESRTTFVKHLLQEDPSVTAWWLSGAEMYSALCRRTREGAISEAGLREAQKRRDTLFESIALVKPAQRVLTIAERLLGMHNLRCADALQLAAAILAFERALPNIEFVTLDERLGAAAQKEGFKVIGVG